MTAHEEGHGRATDRTLTHLATIRLGGFYVALIGALALYAVLMGEMLAFVLVGWFEPPGVHHFHELVMFGLIWFGVLGIALQLYRPEGRVNAAVASVLIMLPLAAIAISTDSPIAMVPILFGAIGLVVAALHPAGRSLVRIDRAGPANRTLGGLLVLGAIPLALYAGDQLVSQYAFGDEHAAFVHYGGMATVAGFVLVMGALATIRARDRRYAAWNAGGLAAYLGLAATVYPDQQSSAGVLWGILAILWGVAFVVAFEYTRRRES